MKKVFKFAFLLSMAFGTLSCSKFKASGVSSSKTDFSPVLDTEKKVFLNVVGVYGNFEALEKVFSDFNEYYPNVVLSYEYTSNMEDMIENRCASKENIDFIFLNSPEYDYFYQDFADKYFVDLNKTSVDLSAIDKKILNATSINGSQKFLPVYFMTTGLLVNETFLAKHKLSIPKNIKQFEEVCDKLVAEGITPIYTNSDGSGLLLSNHVFSQIRKSKNKEKIAHDLNKGQEKNDIFADALKIHNNWKNKKYFDFSGNILADRYESIIYRFLEGDIPFMVANSDIISGIRKREIKSVSFKKSPFRYTFIPAPTSENGMDCTLIPSLFFCLCNVSDNMDYATEFMRYLATRAALETMTVVKGMPSVISDTNDDRLIHFDKLSDSERYIIGEDELSRRSANSIYNSCIKFNEAEKDSSIISAYYESIIDGYQM